MDAIRQLKEEHRGALLMLDILESVCRRLEEGRHVDLSHPDRILDFLKGFVDSCHHAKEEECFFPALEQAGLPRESGPIRVMLMEHEEGRVRIREMKKALAALRGGDSSAARSFTENARAYGGLLRSHIRKEDDVLFPMAEERLSPEKWEELATLFDKVEEERVGPGRHEAYHAMMVELKGLYLEGGLGRRAG
jgi:hemerythrin-like domain-containing protein